jgi:hypothetical protein
MPERCKIFVPVKTGETKTNKKQVGAFIVVDYV